MPYDSDKHHRRSIRLPDYDYAAEGAYYITLCTHQRQCILSEIVDYAVELSTVGCVIREEWERSAKIRQEIRLGSYVIMPNHLHAIVFIEHNERAIVGATGGRPNAPTISAANHPRGPKTMSLAALIAGFKSATTRRVNKLQAMPDTPFWQRNYYEHIIRDDSDYERICVYIEENPYFWQENREYPTNQ